MKSIYLLALGCLAYAGTIRAAEPVFSAAFSAEDGFTQEDFDRWTFIDANKDEKTWMFSADGVPTRVYYSYHSTNQADDWFISPEITVPAAGTYVVRFTCTGASYGEAIEAWYGSAPTVEGMTVKAYEDLNVLGNPTPANYIASFEAGQKVYLGFHAVSQPDKWRLYMNSVEMVAVANPVDLGVSEIISPVSGEGLGSETVKVRVSNFATTDAAGFDICYTVNDGAPVIEHYAGTLTAGASMEYTFTAKADCSTPRGKYVIKAYTASENDIAPHNDAATATVRHIAAAGIPYYNGFEPDDDTSNFIYLNLNNDSGDWDVGVNEFWTHYSRTGSGYLAYNYDKNNAGDDWVFIDPLEVEAGDYVIRFWHAVVGDHKERLRVCWGDAATPEAMTNTICEFNPMTNEEYEEAIAIFNVPTARKIFVGFYAFSDPDENWLLVDDLSIEAADASLLDIQVNDISAPGDYLRPNNKRDVTAEIRNISATDKTVDVSLYIDGKLASTRKETFRLMEVRSISFANALAGLTDGAHTIKVEAACPDEADVTNNVLEKNIMMLSSAPVAIWDFEDEEFPAGCTFRIEDDATIHSAALERFSDRGLAIIPVQNHYLYGNNTFGICTWFTDATARADRWFVLPQLHIGGEDTHLVWDCSSMSAKDYDDYDVCVSTGDDKWYDYTTVLSVKGENEFAKTRGVSLGAYTGKDVYVAFHLKTVNGMALILDNVGLYGDVVTAGVDNVAAGTGVPSLRYIDGRLECGVQSRITVFALDGTVAAEGEGLGLDLAGLSAGVYVARATSAAGAATVKFVVK